MECVFCRIVRECSEGRECSERVVDESGSSIAVKDENPEAPVHIIIIPKRHYATIMECKDREVLSDMLLMAQRIAEKTGVDKSGFRLVINTGVDALQTVPHLNIHLLGGRRLMGAMG